MSYKKPWRLFQKWGFSEKFVNPEMMQNNHSFALGQEEVLRPRGVSTRGKARLCSSAMTIPFETLTLRGFLFDYSDRFRNAFKGVHATSLLLKPKLQSAI